MIVASYPNIVGDLQMLRRTAWGTIRRLSRMLCRFDSLVTTRVTVQILGAPQEQITTDVSQVWKIQTVGPN